MDTPHRAAPLDDAVVVTGHHPSMGAIGERATWFRDREGSLLGISELVVPSWPTVGAASPAAAGRRASGQAPVVVEVLQQLVGGELDLLVLPLGRPVVAGDQARPVEAPEVPEDEGVPRLGVVARPLGEAEVPGGVVVPRVRLEEAVLVVGARLGPAPLAAELVLVGVDEGLGLGDGLRGSPGRSA